MAREQPSVASSEKLNIVITDANSGIGLDACKILCSAGHKVFATVRSEEKGEQCLKEIRSRYPTADVSFMILDMASVSSIHYFVKLLRERLAGAALNVLVNNAGVFLDTWVGAPHHPDWELTMATNCIGPVLLTDLLLKDLGDAAAQQLEARVIMVSSSIICPNKFLDNRVDFGDLMLTKPSAFKNGGVAYRNSKISQMLATLALTDELVAKNINVKVVSMCPGVIPGTTLVRDANVSTRFCFRCLMGCLCAPCVGSHSMEWGGQLIVDLAVGEQGSATGMFFVKGDLKEPPPECQDKGNQKAMLSIVRSLAASALSTNDVNLKHASDR